MYQPSKTILKRYADVLIKFALWDGKGINTDDIVKLSIPESAKPLLPYLLTSVYEAGGHPIVDFQPEGFAKIRFKHANNKQLLYYPKALYLEEIKTITHVVSIISTNDKYELKGIDSEKIMMRRNAADFYRVAHFNKEYRGELTWTVGLFGTQAMAKDVGMSLKEYWQQIIDACFLNDDDPISTWKKVFTEIEYIRSTLSNMPITSLHISGEDVDLTVSMGKNRKWLGGGGRNIPSFEVFTSPDWRGTNGTIRFNQPLYRYGNLIKDISLEFKDGLVTNATASENEKLLKDMIQVENANKIDEFSLTDKRHSKITKFMGETLFDENMGGEFGNTHIALGMAYKDTHTNDPSTIADDIWEELGFNDSAVHTDIVSTTNRVVEATLTDGSQKIIYENGMFTL